MKQVINVLVTLFLVCSTATSFAQTSTELVFKNAVLQSGTDKMLGATYRFYNVTNGTDALLTIVSSSNSENLVNNIDVTEFGWDRAFQPQIGKGGDVPANQDWWVRFNLKFVHAGTSTKKKLDKFYATAMDVDGDNYVIQEYIQMYNADSVAYRTSTQLTQAVPFNAGIACNSKTNMSLGPVQNYTDIDTSARQVMVTYTFDNTDEIDFVYGAKVGNGISNAGLRFNSLWFKAFNLNSNAPLPLINSDFILTYDKRNVNMQWKSAPVDQIGTFIIERSTDGIRFEKISQLQANDQTATYSFTDPNVSSASGLLYYRILYREKSMESKYSGIKVVRLNKEASAALAVYPNPVQRSANLTLPYNWQNKQVVVNVYNAAGVQVKSFSIKAASQTEPLEFENLSRGIYVVKALCQGQWAEQRIIKN